MAVILMAAALPYRRAGGNGEVHAHVPFRPATAIEIALLMEESTDGHLGPPGVSPAAPAAEVTALSEDEVVVTASMYVLLRGGERREPEFRAVSWNGYRVEHRIARSALEAAIGKLLSHADVVAAPDARRVSFRSDRWVAYAGVELGLLTGLFALGAAICFLVRPLLLLPLAVAPWLVLWSGVVAWFSPAFFDGDFFHQRVVIEDLGLLFGFVGVRLLPVAALLAVGAGLAALVRGAASVGARPSLARLAGAASLVPLALGAVLLAWTWNARCNEATSRAEAAARCLNPALLARIARDRGSVLAGSGETSAASGLSWAACSTPDRHGGQPSLLIPLADGRYLLVMETSRGRHLDVRELRSEHSSTIGADEIERALATGESAVTPFGVWLATRVLQNYDGVDGAVPIREGTTVVGVVVESIFPD